MPRVKPAHLSAISKEIFILLVFNINMLNGGEGGIRTPDALAGMPHFECGAIDHSATSPSPLVRANAPCC